VNLGIRGRKAIVNGGSAGIGRSSALALAREGVNVFISARNEERLLRSCEAIAVETGANVTPIVADHSTDAGREKILGICPAPDILVGTASPPPFTDDFRTVTVDDWRSTLDITLMSPVQFIQATIGGMVDRRWGRIVNISTGAAKYPNPLRILSGPPRAALANYCGAVAKKVAKYNVTINTVLPIMHHTDGIRAILEQRGAAHGRSYDEEVAELIRTMPIPAEKFGDADDTGAFVAMFCSEFANYVTGQSLLIDGGAFTSIF
jgi:3-oxoacyl-[acyl-carrier protein] reductase